MNCLIPASCKAGICFTPSFEASQVVPQKKLTQHKARMGNPMAFILDEKAFFILVLNYKFGFLKVYSKTVSTLSLEIVFPKVGLSKLNSGKAKLNSRAFCV